MNYLVKKLLQKGIVQEKDVFFLEKTLPVKDSFSSPEIDEIVVDIQGFVRESDQGADRQEIEDAFWSIRKQILEQPGSAKKIALCISIDLAINKEYQENEKERYLIKLISTIVVQYL